MNIQITYNVITTTKLKESVDFYCNLFNYEVVADIGWYNQLKHESGAELAFMEPNHPSQPEMFQHQWDGKGLIISVQVENIQEAYDSVNDLKIPIDFKLTEEEWGQTHFGIHDPNGIPVDIVQHT